MGWWWLDEGESEKEVNFEINKQQQSLMLGSI